MRNLLRNERQMWYATYVGMVDVVDANGDNTGDKTLSYSAPAEFWATLSPGRGYNAGFAGTLSQTVFGAEIDSERRIMTTDLTLPITETTLIWLEEPGLRDDGTADPDTATFSVTAKPSDGLNFLAIPVQARILNA